MQMDQVRGTFSEHPVKSSSITESLRTDHSMRLNVQRRPIMQVLASETVLSRQDTHPPVTGGLDALGQAPHALKQTTANARHRRR